MTFGVKQSALGHGQCLVCLLVLGSGFCYLILTFSWAQWNPTVVPQPSHSSDSGLTSISSYPVVRLKQNEK